jgi:protein-S-isoprenylcysteine O-methyltransferase Ste14
MLQGSTTNPVSEMSTIGQSTLPTVHLDLDLLERLTVTVLLGFMTARMVPAVLANATYLNIVLLFSEAVVVFFIVFRRRAAAISRHTGDWIIGFAGTFVALLAMQSEGEPIIPTSYCLLLMLTGFFLQTAAKLTLRRSFGLVAANRGVKIDGPYRLVRHPMYAGYTLTHIGFLLSGPTLWNVCVYTLAFGLFVARILAEERILSEDAAYQSFCTKVRYRLIPFVF